MMRQTFPPSPINAPVVAACKAVGRALIGQGRLRGLQVPHMLKMLLEMLLNVFRMRDVRWIG
jgi:hypothetical protein